MTRINPRLPTVALGRHEATLSRGQKAFNRLIQQIEKRRARLGAWEAISPIFQEKYVGELLPLEQIWTDLQVQMVYRLDQACDQKGLTKTERRTISGLIAGLAGGLIEKCDDAQLKAIYNRHSPSDYDSGVTAGLGDMKSMLEGMLGAELGDDIDLSSPEDLLQRAQAKMEERHAQESAENQAREERRAKRKKSAKQAAAEARKEAEQGQLSQSIREVYRKLASALHPDRETDLQERERKTALMQRVNQAYGKNNLLQLLELQLELEHIDQSAIDNIGEDKLKHYNKILKEQLGELDQEILHVEFGFKQRHGMPPFLDLSPGTVVRELDGEIARLRQRISGMGEDLLVFDDPRELKSWLRSVKREVEAFDFGEMRF